MRSRSALVMSTHHVSYKEQLQAASIATVKVVTDDLQIDIGYLLRKDARYTRVATCTYSRHKRRNVWEVLSIRNDRIMEMVTLN